MSEIRIQKTGEPDVIEASDGRLTLSVPIQIKRRSGRKLVTLPSSETAPVRPWDVTPTTLQLALARGHRWLAILESGEAKSLKEIAAREGIDNSYVSRMVNLTTLAPDIVAAILDDTLPNHITLFDLAVDPPALWDEQRADWAWKWLTSRQPINLVLDGGAGFQNRIELRLIRQQQAVLTHRRKILRQRRARCAFRYQLDRAAHSLDVVDLAAVGILLGEEHRLVLGHLMRQLPIGGRLVEMLGSRQRRQVVPMT